MKIHDLDKISIMSELDLAKETIAYLKFWLGVMVVSDISLVGWLLSNAGVASEINARHRGQFSHSNILEISRHPSSPNKTLHPSAKHFASFQCLG